MKTKIIVILLYVFLIACKNTPILCEVYISCDPNKEGECDAIYKEAQKLCESKKNN